MCVNGDKFLILFIYYIFKKPKQNTQTQKTLNPKIISQNDVKVESYGYTEIKE